MEALVPPFIGILLNVSVVLIQLEVGSSHRFFDVLYLEDFHLFSVNFFELIYEILKYVYISAEG